MGETGRPAASDLLQKAEVSERAKRKAATKTTETGLPAHSLRTMLQDLGNLTCNEATLPGQPNHPFTTIVSDFFTPC